MNVLSTTVAKLLQSQLQCLYGVKQMEAVLKVEKKLESSDGRSALWRESSS